MAFQIPSVPPTTNKNIRFPNTLIAQVEELIRGKNPPFPPLWWLRCGRRWRKSKISRIPIVDRNLPRGASWALRGALPVTVVPG